MALRNYEAVSNRVNSLIIAFRGTETTHRVISLLFRGKPLTVATIGLLEALLNGLALSFVARNNTKRIIMTSVTETRSLHCSPPRRKYNRAPL